MPSNVAMKEYGFMKSAEILFSEREKPRIIGRYTYTIFCNFEGSSEAPCISGPSVILQVGLACVAVVCFPAAALW